MNTYLIKIPQDNKQTAAAFEEVFIQLHETLRGQKVAFEMLATGQNIAFTFTADEATSQVVSGQVYAVAPAADIIKITDFTKKLSSKANSVATELKLVRKDLFPIKNFTEFELEWYPPKLSIWTKLSEQAKISIWSILDTFWQIFRPGAIETLAMLAIHARSR